MKGNLRNFEFVFEGKILIERGVGKGEGKGGKGNVLDLFTNHSSDDDTQ